jgi:hypothetical protein
MDNNTATRPRSPLKGDPYRAFEELPAEVRRALQESLVDWCPLRAREWHLHLLRQDAPAAARRDDRPKPAKGRKRPKAAGRKSRPQPDRRDEHLRAARAAATLVRTIRRMDHAEVAAFARRWPAGAEGYPHLAAGATIQRYSGRDGLPES